MVQPASLVHRVKFCLGFDIRKRVATSPRQETASAKNRTVGQTELVQQVT